MKIFEGLREGDLAGLVLPILSIDQFESKIDDDAIVIGFYVQDRDPANDMNRFIQKSAVDLLDTDVSPAPNEDGFYMVFLELLRDHEVPEKILTILDSLEGLTNIAMTDWKAEFQGHEGEAEVNEKTLKVLIRMDPVEDEIEAMEKDADLSESLRAFFRPSILDNMTYDKGSVTLERRGATLSLSLVDFGTMDVLKECNAVMAQPLKLDESSQYNVRRLQAFLGSHWLVEHLEGYVVLSHDMADEVALFRL